MLAITSLSPSPGAAPRQAACLASWRASGLNPVALAHPSEIAALGGYGGLEVVPTEDTSVAQFGRHYVRVNAVVDLVVARGEPALIANADLGIVTRPARLDSLAALARQGLPYLLQWNTGQGLPVVEPCGFSAFLLLPEHAYLFRARSFLCLGQPWWDYWLPYAFVADGRPVFTPVPPLAYHEHHEHRWNAQHWMTCAAEMGRLVAPHPDTSTEAGCRAFSAYVHDAVKTATVHVVFGEHE